MKYTLANPCTQTPGYGKIIRKGFSFDRNLLNHPNLKNEEVIINLDGYAIKVKENHSNKGSRGSLDKQLYAKLRLLGKYLSLHNGKKIDPLEYMIQLYFGEEQLGISDICDRLNFFDSSLNFKEDSLRYAFKEIFKWELFSSTHKRRTTDAKTTGRHKGMVDFNKKNNAKLDKENQEIAEKILKELNNSSDFNLQEYKNLKYKSRKFVYLFQVYLKVSIKEILTELKAKKIGHRRLAKIFQIVIDDISSKNEHIQDLGEVTVRLIQTIVENNDKTN